MKTVIPGQPSLPTMVNFILLAAAGILTTLNPLRLPSTLNILGIVIGATGAFVIIGYVFNVPLLHYFIEGVSSAMACNTAILFVLTGTGLICLSD